MSTQKEPVTNHDYWALEDDYKRLTADNARLTAEVSELRKDRDRLCLVERQCLTVECYDSPTPGGDDSQEMWRVVEYHMAAPKARYIGYGTTPRAAIDDAAISK